MRDHFFCADGPLASLVLTVAETPSPVQPIQVPPCQCSGGCVEGQFVYVQTQAPDGERSRDDDGHLVYAFVGEIQEEAPQ